MKFVYLLCGLLYVSGLTIVQGNDSQDSLILEDKNDNNETETDSTTSTTTTTSPTTSTDVTSALLVPDVTSAPLVPDVPEVDGEHPPRTGKYNLTSDNVTCILLQAAIRFNFTYTKETDTNTTKEVYILHDIVPNATTVGGGCAKDGNVETMTLHFFTEWVLTMKFTRNKDHDHYELTSLQLNYTMDKDYFPDTTTNGSKAMYSYNDQLTEFKVDTDKSLKCKSEVNIDNFKEGNLTNMYTWDVHVQAFRTTDDGKYDDPMYCDADTKVSNLVPIIVGAALAGLVLIVLVAYLIGRTRNKRGYESV